MKEFVQHAQQTHIVNAVHAIVFIQLFVQQHLLTLQVEVVAVQVNIQKAAQM